MGVDLIGTSIKLNINNTASEHILILSGSRGGTDTLLLLIIDNILICKHLDKQDINITHMNFMNCKIVNTVSRLREMLSLKGESCHLICSSNAHRVPCHLYG